jgi:beta-phosphoglucomutase-like phosphatase (HAD superfamily)
MDRKAGAIFDWDGVIINSAAHHEASWERLAKECGKTLPENHFKRGFGMKNEVIIPELLGWTSVPTEVRILSLRKEALYREVVREQGIEALPGVREWLKRSRRASPASSAPRRTAKTSPPRSRCSAGGFLRRHRHRRGREARQARPGSLPHRRDRIGVEPGRAVVFEDALVGIAAAKAAGMRVVAVATTEPKDKLAHADWIVDRLDELSVAQLWDTHAAGH